MTSGSQVGLRPKRALDLITMPEWGTLCSQRPNALVQGSEDSTEGMVMFLAPYLRRPVLWMSSRAPFELPSEACGALVIDNVAGLGREEQSRVLRWLDDHGDRTQVISTTTEPLFPLVGRGLFDEALYYRLNVLLLCVDSSNAGA